MRNPTDFTLAQAQQVQHRLQANGYRAYVVAYSDGTAQVVVSGYADAAV